VEDGADASNAGTPPKTPPIPDHTGRLKTFADDLSQAMTFQKLFRSFSFIDPMTQLERSSHRARHSLTPPVRIMRSAEMGPTYQFPSRFIHKQRSRETSRSRRFRRCYEHPLTKRQHSPRKHRRNPAYTKPGYIGPEDIYRP
jgi:hypothetical protein